MPRRADCRSGRTRRARRCRSGARRPRSRASRRSRPGPRRPAGSRSRTPGRRRRSTGGSAGRANSGPASKPRFPLPGRPLMSRFRLGENVRPIARGERSSVIASRTRHAQLDLQLPVARLPELDDEVGADLEGAGQVRHAAARLVVLALGRHRRAEADVDDDPAAGEQDRAGAVAVGAQEAGRGRRRTAAAAGRCWSGRSRGSRRSGTRRRRCRAPRAAR